MTSITKHRREWFGGLVYSENPGFTAFVDPQRADMLGIPSSNNLTERLFSAPLDVHISITNRCNLRCRGCYAQRGNEPVQEMPLDLAKAVIDRLSDLDVFTIALGGGEPFLHPQLFDIATHSRKAGIVPNVTTNGLCIDDETAKRCKVFGSVHISCHRPAEMPRLEESVRFLKSAGIDIGLNVLVSADTYTELPNIWAWCARQRISRLLLLKFKMTTINSDCQDMVLSAEQEQDLIPLIRQLSHRHSVMPMLDCSFFPALACSRPDRRDLEFFDVNGCLGGNAILAVTIDGQFKPCSFCQNTCGDILALNRNLWKENEDLSDFRHRHLHAECNTCAYEDLCNGGCRVSKTEWCRNQKDSEPEGPGYVSQARRTCPSPFDKGKRPS